MKFPRIKHLQPITYVDPIEVNARLSQLGLTVQILRDAVLAGEVARNGCTKNDPPILRGILPWGRTLRALREILIPDGWRRDDKDNFSTVIDSGGMVALTTSLGDDATGNPRLTPKTKHPKGGGTENVIDLNRQLELFQQAEIPAPRSLNLRATWFLLIYRTSDEIQVELSLPAALGSDDRVEEWTERVILEPIRLSSDPTSSREELPDIEIAVTRKAG